MWTLPTLGGSVYALSFSPVATGLLALGGADQMIRSWDTLSLQNPYLTKTFWQGIRSKITAVRLALDIGDLGLGLGGVTWGKHKFNAGYSCFVH